MAVAAIPYLFAASMATTAVATYVSVKSNRDAAANARTIGDLNAQASLKHGEENAQAAESQGEAEARIAERQAAAQFQQAQAEASTIRRNNERVRGSQRVAFLKSGVTLSGTAQDVIYDSAIEGELEALATTYRGRVGASYMADQAAFARSQGETTARLTRSRAQTDAVLSRYDGQVRSNAYKAQATGSLLSGIGQMASTAFSYGAYRAAGPSFS